MGLLVARSHSIGIFSDICQSFDSGIAVGMLRDFQQIKQNASR